MIGKKKRTLKDIEKRLDGLRDAGRPWRVEHYIGKDRVDIGWSVYSNHKVDNKYEVIIGYGLTKEDAYFIANAAEDIDFLLNKLKKK
jgi:hypothetical protein